MHLAVNAKRGPLCLYVRSLGWRGCCATRTDTNKPPRPATHTHTIYAYTHTHSTTQHTHNYYYYDTTTLPQYATHTHLGAFRSSYFSHAHMHSDNSLSSHVDEHQLDDELNHNLWFLALLKWRPATSALGRNNS